jgi:hypothetical protein
MAAAKNTGHGEKGSRHADAAILALMTEPTIAGAAAKAGIAENTLARWLKRPKFLARYRAARRRALEAGLGKIQECSAEAAVKLRALVGSSNERVALAAVKAVFEIGVRAVEVLDLAEKVAELEQTLRGLQRERERAKG